MIVAAQGGLDRPARTTKNVGTSAAARVGTMAGGVPMALGAEMQVVPELGERDGPAVSLGVTGAARPVPGWTDRNGAGWPGEAPVGCTTMSAVAARPGGRRRAVEAGRRAATVGHARARLVAPAIDGRARAGRVASTGVDRVRPVLAAVWGTSGGMLIDREVRVERDRPPVVDRPVVSTAGGGPCRLGPPVTDAGTAQVADATMPRRPAAAGDRDRKGPAGAAAGHRTARREGTVRTDGPMPAMVTAGVVSDPRPTVLRGAWPRS